MQGREIKSKGKRKREENTTNVSENTSKRRHIEGDIHSLPPELLTYAFQYMTDKDLRLVSFVNKQWKEASVPNWRWQILRYFSYLEDAKDYSENPQYLYNKEYQRYVRLAEELGVSDDMAFVLESLSGNLSTLQELSPTKQKAAYILAAANGHIEAIEKLNDFQRGLAISIAAQNGQLKAIEYLCQTEEDTLSAVKTARKYGKFSIVAFLDPAQENSVIKAAASGDLEKVKAELESRAKEDCAFLRQEGRFWAAACGHLHVVKYLFDQEKRAVYQGKCVGDETESIRAAIRNGHNEIVRYFWDTQNLFPSHTLSLAAEYGNSEVIQFILQSGDKSFTKDLEEVLCSAAESGHVDTIKTLLEETKNMLFEQENPLVGGEFTEVEGLSLSFIVQALNQATIKGHIRVAKFLFDNDLAPLISDSKLWEFTLHIAARHGQLGIVHYLCEKIDFSETAILQAKDAAQYFGKTQIIAFLEKKLIDMKEKANEANKASRCSIM